VISGFCRQVDEIGVLLGLIRSL